MYYERATAGPGIHALVIGISGYPHLPGGTADVRVDDVEFHGVGQLLSPVPSALSFAEVLRMANETSSDTPLASLEVLLAPHPGDPLDAGVAATVQEPTMRAIREAVTAWRERAERHHDNVAVFYYCGHGFQQHAGRILLGSDFGAYPVFPFEHAFDFHRLVDACLQRPPATQCFFVDSCASVPPNLESDNVYGLCEILRPTPRLRPRAQNVVSVLATPPYEKAVAFKGEVSYFTKALVDALGGAAAHPNGDGEWAVDIARLHAPLTQLVRRYRGDDFQRPVFEEHSGSAELWRLPGPPAVRFTVECDPTAAHLRAQLSCRSKMDSLTPPLIRPVPERTPWEVSSPPGVYVLAADFADQSYLPMFRDAFIQPPGEPQRLRVRS